MGKPGQSPKTESLIPHPVEFTEGSPFGVISGQGVVYFTPNPYTVAKIPMVTLRSHTFLLKLPLQKCDIRHENRKPPELCSWRRGVGSAPHSPAAICWSFLPTRSVDQRGCKKQNKLNIHIISRVKL